MTTIPKPVSDELLDRLCAIARLAQAGRCDAAGANLLVHLMPELLDELRTRRAAQSAPALRLVRAEEPQGVA